MLIICNAPRSLEILDAILMPVSHREIVVTCTKFTFELKECDVLLLVNEMLEFQIVGAQDLDKIILIFGKTQCRYEQVVVDTAFRAEIAVHGEACFCLETKVLRASIETDEKANSPKPLRPRCCMVRFPLMPLVKVQIHGIEIDACDNT